MARETWKENLRALEALNIRPDDHVLDIGCGHGRALSELALRAPHGRIAGADPSRLMAEMATERNQRHIRAGRIEIS
jgi:ubiquinone/menaquinone biosynthesis C-methylase UbiE